MSHAAGGFTRVIAATSVAALGVGLAAIPASSAPTPRVSESQCSAIADTNGGTGYVVVDPTSNTSCVVKVNGTFVWANSVESCKNSPVKFRGSLLPNTRGDVVAKVKVRYIRGNKVIKKWIKLKSKRTFATSQEFNKKGTWTATFTYKGKTVSTKVKVVSCTTS